MTTPNPAITMPRGAAAPKPAESTRSEKLSELLERLARDMGDKITMRELAEALEDRSFGAFLLVFALPNLIPLPPGATLLLGLPMAVVAWQMVLGYPKVWLPAKLADCALDRATFQSLAARIAPWLRRAENWVRPRAWPIAGRNGERVFGLFALVLALVCVLPIPLGNWPPAFSVAILGIAHAERDGNVLAIGVVAGILSLVVAGAVVSMAAFVLFQLI